jgi:hypothetical protein
LIVISGALVLVAAVLLVLGIISSITLVYAAIGLSIVSAVFLLVGVFQRPAPAAEPRESESDGTRRVIRHDEDDIDDRPAKKPVTVSKDPEPPPVEHIDLSDESAAPVEDPDEVAADFPLEKANADFEARSAATGADVLVISGRPRYHVGGCEYVEGNPDSEPLEINEARELGFTPCGTCRPNETLARSAAGKEHPPTPKPKPAPVSQPATASYEPAPVTMAAAAAPASHVADPQQNHVAPQVSEPVAYATAPSAPPAPPAPPPVAAEPPPVAVEPPPVVEAPPPAVVTPVTPPPVAAVPEPEAPVPPAAAPAAGRTTRARTVCAVASTKEYHRPDCEMLVGADAEEITRVAAIRQGYLACGICKP